MIKLTPPTKGAGLPSTRLVLGQQPTAMKWLLIGITIFLIVLTLIAGSALLYAQSYRSNFFPGVSIAGQSLQGQTHAQALAYWQNQADLFQENGLQYLYGDEKITVEPIVTAIDTDASYRLADFDVLKTIDAAYLAGRQKGYSQNLAEQLKALIAGTDFPMAFTLNEEILLASLKNNFASSTSPKLNARPQIDEAMRITILEEQAGNNFNYPQIIEQTKAQLASLNAEPIVLELTADLPEIKKAEIGNETIAKIEEILRRPKLIISYHNDEWAIANTIFKDWLAFAKEDDQIKVIFDWQLAEAYIKKEIAAEIDQPALDARFAITNGKVAEFQGSQDGQALEIAKTFAKINEAFIGENKETVEAVVAETKSKISTGSLNDLGVTEIIGTGESDFKGSPKNRRHNIKVGANSLNGILIKPGETFSLVAALGNVNAAQGYLPELVIKGDRTIPEYGGGLCQVATTVFRAAVGSGLPITARKSHAYRVVYYEPAGKDATIYIPNPDLKFTNDTNEHILIQSRIEGDELLFDFWGTKDGRQIEESDSVIYNIKPAGPTIMIETTDLKPGEKRCTESAHAGADAYFDYKVIYPNGEVKEERFSSHYVPWPAKCLIGKAPAPETTPTSTPVLLQ